MIKNAPSSPGSNYAAIPMAPAPFGGAALSRDNSFAEINYTAVRSTEPAASRSDPKALTASNGSRGSGSSGGMVSYALAEEGDV
jgi:hypothetical protein